MTAGGTMKYDDEFDWARSVERQHRDTRRFECAASFIAGLLIAAALMCLLIIVLEISK